MFLGTGLMALGLLWAGARQRSRLLVAAGLGTLGLLVAASMVDVATTGLSARYAFPLFMPAALLALTVLAAPSAPLTPIFSPRTVAIGMSMCLIGSLWYGSALSFKGMLSSLRKPPQNLAQGAEQTHALQAAVPAGQRILTVYPRVYQMDFRRNPIWQIDLVGACSPPPGLPLGQGGEKVRDYLRHNGVRYMIVSLRDFAPIANEYFRSRTHSPNPWQRRYTDNCIQWETDLKQLVAVSAVLKQDGPVYVLDLGAAVQ
jgi:hypothetical protein